MVALVPKQPHTLQVKLTSDYPPSVSLSLSPLKSSNAHEHFETQTQRFKAWIIDLTAPLRVHSAPWCNSPEDASVCRNM